MNKNLFSSFLIFFPLFLIFIWGCRNQPLEQHFEGMVPGFDNRNYTVYLPNNYNNAQNYPLIIGLHGGGGNKENFRRTTCPGGNLNSSNCLDRMANENGYITVFANGTLNPKKNPFWGNRFWNAGGGQKGFTCIAPFACLQNIDDISYLNALITHLNTILNIDSNRIFLTGISNGAAMSHRAACELSDKILGIAGIAGANQFAADPSFCQPANNVSILQIHGVDDPQWPYEGGPGINENIYFGVQDSTNAWGNRYNCNAPIITGPVDHLPFDGTSYEKWTFQECGNESQVLLYKIYNGGHTWPQGWQYLNPDFIGLTSQEFSANQVMIEFFNSL